MRVGNGTKFRRVDWVLLAAGMTLFTPNAPTTASEGPAAPDGWTTSSPREEIRPEFAREPGADDGPDCLVIKAEGREGVAGCWRKTTPVVGGKAYRFQAFYRA